MEKASACPFRRPALRCRALSERKRPGPPPRNPLPPDDPKPRTDHRRRGMVPEKIRLPVQRRRLERRQRRRPARHAESRQRLPRRPALYPEITKTGHPQSFYALRMPFSTLSRKLILLYLINFHFCFSFCLNSNFSFFHIQHCLISFTQKTVIYRYFQNLSI